MMAGNASRHCSSYTLRRTISQPAWARARTWASVAAASRVSVLVMLCTVTGAPPPMGSGPMENERVLRMGICLLKTWAV